MSIHIQQVLDYLETNLVMKKANSMDSLLGMLYDAYATNHCFGSQEVRESFQKIYSSLDKLPREDSDTFFMLLVICVWSRNSLPFHRGY